MVDSAAVLYFGLRPVGLFGTETTTPQNGGAPTVSSSVIYLSTDHLGTPILATDATGVTLWQGGFEPFGRDFAEARAAGQFLRFPGQWDDGAWSQDGLDSLVYNLNRWYDQRSGRYSQEDPLGTDGIDNLYHYATSNPLVNIDPSGECPWCVAALFGGLTDLGVQLLFNDFDFGCVDWGQVLTSAALSGVGVGLATKLAKAGKLGTVTTTHAGPSRPTYRFFKAKGKVRIESHPPRRWLPDWLSWPHWHADFLKPAKGYHLPLVEPIVGGYAAGREALEDDDCGCEK